MYAMALLGRWIGRRVSAMCTKLGSESLIEDSTLFVGYYEKIQEVLYYSGA